MGVIRAPEGNGGDYIGIFSQKLKQVLKFEGLIIPLPVVNFLARVLIKIKGHIYFGYLYIFYACALDDFDYGLKAVAGFIY